MDFKDLLGKGLDENKTLVMECTQMLEKYLSCFPKETGCASFSGEDMKRWKEEFFPKLVQTGEIIDYQFFNNRNQSVGVGCDGAFTGYEYFQIMYRLYKKLYELEAIK